MHMHVYQMIFPALLVLAFIGACIRSPRKTIGGVIGGVLGVLIPFLLSELYVWRGGDPTAAGAYSFICILTLPLGIAIGVLVATWTARGKGTSDKDKG
jgi:CDP-diglyceride synthetase